MKPKEVFKRYDIRGKYVEEIDKEFAELLGKSLGTWIQDSDYRKDVIVCRDNKVSSKELKPSLIKGLRSTGVDVYDASVGPTDYAAFTGNLNNRTSIQITASHMPLNFTGFKLMYPEGNGFLNEDLNKIKELFIEKKFENNPKGEKKHFNKLKMYKSRIKEFAKEFDLNWSGKVVVESMGGASHNLFADLLRDLGCDVEEINFDEKFPYRDPPNPEHEAQLEDLIETVDSCSASVGLATDMDGDRIALYKNGRLYTGDEIFLILSKLIESDIVASVDTSQIIKDNLDKRGFKIHYTRVGDPFVMNKAIKEGVKFAGEPNGHFAFLDFVAYNSGILSGVLLAGLNEEDYDLNSVNYETFKRSINVSNKFKAMKNAKKYVKQNYEVISEVDGIKFNLGKGSCLIRASGSSEILRVKFDTLERENNKASFTNLIDSLVKELN